LLAEASPNGRRGPQLLREIGTHPEGGTVGLYRGRYGPYVSHEGVIASLPRGADPATFSLDEAVLLLAAQNDKRKARRKTGKAASTKAAAGKGTSTREPGGPGTKKKKPARTKKAGTPRTAKKASTNPSAQPGRQ
jgi:DNA topoisomerase-1